MLYLVKMTVNAPLEPDDRFEKLKHEEKKMAHRLQREGVWRHLWRVAGRYENYSVFEVESHDALHAHLTALPLFPYLDLEVVPLARHPSALAEEVL